MSAPANGFNDDLSRNILLSCCHSGHFSHPARPYIRYFQPSPPTPVVPGFYHICWRTREQVISLRRSSRFDMGNTQTKETRSSLTPSNRRNHHSSQGGSSGRGRSPYGHRHHGEGSRSARGSGPDLSFLGIGGSSERHVATLEHRRETKQEREARRLEKERAARIKERERSMKEEHVDGGYLVTQGVYVGTEDFNKAVIRQLMVNIPGLLRRTANC